MDIDGCVALGIQNISSKFHNITPEQQVYYSIEWRMNEQLTHLLLGWPGWPGWPGWYYDLTAVQYVYELYVQYCTRYKCT